MYVCALIELYCFTDVGVEGHTVSQTQFILAETYLTMLYFILKGYKSTDPLHS